MLPDIYGGEAELIPIEQAVQARLVREGIQRQRIASNAAAATAAAEATEGRLTRAGRSAISVLVYTMYCTTNAPTELASGHS